MRIELRVVIDYDVSDYEEEANALSEIQGALHRAAEFMAGKGAFEAGTNAVVESYECHTDMLEE